MGAGPGREEEFKQAVLNIRRIINGFCERTVLQVMQKRKTKIILKGARCFTDKCAIDRKPYVPGQKSKMRLIESEYYSQLREKQKAKRYYGVLEKQFRNYYKHAVKSKGITGEVLLQLLETRLDNVIYLMGFAVSSARQTTNIAWTHSS